jgi:hypothetical protein
VAGQGGFTTVSGTIVGAVDGLTWSCGSISAQLITAGGVSPTLNGGGFSTSVSPVTLGCPTSPGTGAPGSFTMRLADSGQISPSTTTWQFTVNMTPGIAPPAGTGPQSFTYTTAINCSTNTPSTCTANAMSISVQLSALAPKLSNASGVGSSAFSSITSGTNNTAAMVVGTGASLSASGSGTIAATTATIAANGFSLVSSVPASCTPGTSQSIALTVAPFGIYDCRFNLAGIGVYQANGNSLGVIDVQLNFGAPVANECSNANVTITSGSNSVSCSTYTFTAADVGKKIFGTCCGGLGGGAKPTSVIIQPLGVINTVSSAHTVTVCTTTGACTVVNATGNSASGAKLFWGFDATTQLQAAVSAAYTSPGPCPGILIPIGIFFTTSGLGNTTPTCIYPMGFTTDTGVVVNGISRGGSVIMGTPDFSYATCTGLGAQPSCFFGVNGIGRHNFTISGGDFANTGSHAVSLVTASTDDDDWNLGLEGWGAADAAMYGYQMEGPGNYPQYVVEDGAGAVGCVVDATSGPFNNLVGSFCGDNQGITGGGFPCNYWVKTGAVGSTTASTFGSCTGSGAGLVNYTVEGTAFSVNDTLLPFSTNTGYRTDSGGIIHITNAAFANTGGTTGISNGGATGSIFVTNTQVSATTCFLTTGTATIYLDNLTRCTSGAFGSSITPTCSSTGLTQTACAPVAGSTNEKGTIRVTAGGVGGSFTITLTFAGTYAGAAGLASPCQFFYANTGSGSWTAPTLLTLSSKSTSAETVAGTATTVATSTYDMNYNCPAQ